MSSDGTVDEAQIGRFDQSFLIHMIKDFFVILIIVTSHRIRAESGDGLL